VSRPDDRLAGSRPVACERCGAAVQVAKFSPEHTSVQWSQASVRACAEFGARAAGGELTALIDTCASLRASIDRAVRGGRLTVSPPSSLPLSPPVSPPLSPPLSPPDGPGERAGRAG
jgi:hypothetical protein